MNIVSLLKFASRSFSNFAERLEFREANSDIFVYRDCLETIRVLTEFIKPEYLCDIGAHSGDWTYVMSQINRELRHAVLVEPQSKCVNKLNALHMPGIQKVIYGCGLGEKNEMMTIKGGTASASFLEAAPSQTSYFPGSINAEAEEVPVRILDEVYAKDGLRYPDVMKLDVQGYELNVLRGALTVLSRTKYLVVELSFRNFYKGQPQLWEVLKFLEENHFMMVAHGYEWKDNRKPHEILQLDGIFMNTRNVSDKHE
jgi:FkbM family methyltransferase